jgi:regulator of replication initiation timing
MSVIEPDPSAEHHSEEFFGWGAENALDEPSQEESVEAQPNSEETDVEGETEETEAVVDETETEDDLPESEEEAEETEQVEPELAAQQQTPEVTPRASQRIQQLVSEKKTLQENNDKLADTLAQLQQTLAAQQSHQQQKWQEQQTLSQQEQMMQQLQQQGFDPTNLSHQLALEQHYRIQQMEQQQKQWQQQMEQMRIEAAANEYAANLQAALDAQTANLSISPSAKATLNQMALTQAHAFQLSSPAEAVTKALEVYQSLVGDLVQKQPARSTPKPKSTKEERKLQRASSMRGAKAGRSKGDSPSGRRKQKTPVSPEEALFGDLGDW